MKKSLLFLITIIFIVAICVITSYNKLKSEKLNIAKFNLKYEEYNRDNVDGLDIVTLINRATSNNEYYKINKNAENIYILDNEYSIEIYIVFDGTTYSMEKLNNSGLNEFIRYFADVNFKCIDVKYHKKTGRIASLTFEAIDYK